VNKHGNGDLNIRNRSANNNENGKVSIKVGKACVCCGETDINRLDFHHVDPATKRFSIGQARMQTQELILEEIAKCELLCRSCHVTLHYKRRKEV
jgi:hypothetical protein